MQRWAGEDGDGEMEDGDHKGYSSNPLFFNKITYIYILYTYIYILYTFNTIFYPLGKWTWWIITAILYCLMTILGNMRRNLINYLVVFICSSSEINTIKQNLPPKGPLIHIFHRLQPPTSFTILLSLLEQIGSTLQYIIIMYCFLYYDVVVFFCCCISILAIYTDSMHRSCEKVFPWSIPVPGVRHEKHDMFTLW